MILEERKGIVYLKVIVVPKSSQDEVVGVLGDSLKVKVTAAPEKGKATDAAVQVVADFFSIKKSQVQLSSGATSRDKVFTLDMSLATAQRKIDALVPSTLTYIDKCQFTGTVSVNGDQNNVIQNSSFNAITIGNLAPTHYDEKACYKHEDHKMYKAMKIPCPCSGEVPMVIRGKSGRELRMYEDDIVFFNTKGEFESSMADAIRLVKEQQETIKELQKKIQKLEKRRGKRDATS